MALLTSDPLPSAHLPPWTLAPLPQEIVETSCLEQCRNSSGSPASTAHTRGFRETGNRSLYTSALQPVHTYFLYLVLALRRWSLCIRWLCTASTLGTLDPLSSHTQVPSDWLFWHLSHYREFMGAGVSWLLPHRKPQPYIAGPSNCLVCNEWKRREPQLTTISKPLGQEQAYI